MEDKKKKIKKKDKKINIKNNKINNILKRKLGLINSQAIFRGQIDQLIVCLKCIQCKRFEYNKYKIIRISPKLSYLLLLNGNLRLILIKLKLKFTS